MMAYSNSFLSPQEILPIAQENKYGPKDIWAKVLLYVGDWTLQGIRWYGRRFCVLWQAVIWLIRGTIAIKRIIHE